jgi:hypothetical protein
LGLLALTIWLITLINKIKNMRLLTSKLFIKSDLCQLIVPSIGMPGDDSAQWVDLYNRLYRDEFYFYVKSIE